MPVALTVYPAELYAFGVWRIPAEDSLPAKSKHHRHIRLCGREANSLLKV
jgi:hypothetical protein